ncbi:site-specific integrase [Fundicoccus sp. Sow4_H7]|uniref:site-specific integrase n=1 Tax=Fundicoccus sp. Sow4_H7 TaxID=3438784 RepID=UPI003F929299
MVENLDVNGYTYFRILSYSGARKSEILALKWSDIDFDTSTLNINKTLTRGLNNKIIMQPTKTVNGRRIIDMDNDSMKLLKQWKMYQARLGHTDIQTTMNIYAHVTKEEKKDTADKFAKFMEN